MALEVTMGPRGDMFWHGAASLSGWDVIPENLGSTPVLGGQVAELQQSVGDPDHWQSDQRGRIIGRHGLEQYEAGALNLETACTVVGLIVVQVGIGESAIEVPEMDGRLVGMLVASASDRIEYANRREERNAMAGCGEQLFDRILVVSGFAQYRVIEDGQLVRPDNECVAGIDCHPLGLFSGQVTRMICRTEPEIVAFIHVGRHRLKLLQEALQQLSPIPRRRGENDWRGRRILHRQIIKLR